jgi:hypothetical protein
VVPLRPYIRLNLYLAPRLRGVMGRNTAATIFLHQMMPCCDGKGGSRCCGAEVHHRVTKRTSLVRRQIHTVSTPDKLRAYMYLRSTSVVPPVPSGIILSPSMQLSNRKKQASKQTPAPYTKTPVKPLEQSGDKVTRLSRLVNPTSPVRHSSPPLWNETELTWSGSQGSQPR